MNVSSLIRRGQQIFSDNKPTILTGVGIAGTMFTAILAAKAGFRAGQKVQEHEHLHEHEAPVERVGMEQFKYRASLTWKLYVPTAVSAVGTITAIAAANRVSTNRAAALAAAYAITDRAFTEYKDKVVETIGEKKHVEIQDKIAQDRINATAAGAGTVIIIGGEDILCYDQFANVYFKSSMEKIKKAQNDTNYEIMHSMYVSLAEFYGRLGWDADDIPMYAHEIGFNVDNMVELHFTSVMTPDDRTALAYTFHAKPVRGSYT